MIQEKEGRPAGQYAYERYRRVHRAWSRRAVPPALMRILAMCFAYVLVAVFSEGVFRDGWLFGAGIFAGIALALPHFTPAHVRSWERGFDGERRTGEIVDPLRREGWQVIHDLQLPGRRDNLDHVLIGPAGVLVLETKNWSGVANFTDGELEITQPDDPDYRFKVGRLQPMMRRRALELHQHIEETTGQRVWVQPVVVLWGEFPQGVACHGDVVFIHGTRLAPTLRRLPDAKAFDVAAVAASVHAIGIVNSVS